MSSPASQPVNQQGSGMVGRPTAAVLAALALALAVFGTLFVTWETFFGDHRPAFQGNEDVANYLWARSLVVDGDLRLGPDLSATPALDAGAKQNWQETNPAPDGGFANPEPPGWSLASLPAVWAGHGLAGLTGAATDGWSPPYFVALWIWHLAIGAVGLWAAWQVVARFSGRWTAGVAVLAVWIASPLIYYQTARIGVVHGLVFSLTALCYQLTFGIRDEPQRVWRWPVLGLLAGLLLLTRFVAGVYLLFPLLVLWEQAQGPRAATLEPNVRLAIGSLLGIFVIGFAVNLAVNGMMWAGGMQPSLFSWAHAHFWSVLFSPMHGLFYWHPLVLAGIVGLVWGAWRRDLPWSWVIAFVLIHQVNAVWQWSSIGSGFGARGFEGALLFAMTGLAWMLSHLPRWLIVRAALWVGVVAGALLFVLFVVGAIPRDEPVTYAEMLGALWGLVFRT